MEQTLRYAHLIGWGKALPSRVMPNTEFEALVHTSDEWIYTRTGIRERRIAGYGETPTTLAVRAAQQALAVANVLPSEIDLILVATSSPEYIFPSTASIVQDLLGATHAGASDLSAACSGFVYALDLAACKVRSGSVKTALVIGSETMSRVLDWTDRKTCILFGDGAGAVVLQGRDTPGGVISSVLGSDGAGWDLLTLPTVSSKETYQRTLHQIYMDGRMVFRFATRAMVDGITTALDRAGMTPADLDLLIPHQANQRIIDTAAQSLGLPPDKVFSNVERMGNTSAASIPIALAEAADRLKPGDTLGIVGFGGGLTWGAAVIEWSGAPTCSIPALAWGRRQEQYLAAGVRRAWLRRYGRQLATNSPRALLRRYRRRLSRASAARA